MFTGIIRHVGKILAIQDAPSAKRFKINLGSLAEGLAIGDSVCVSGACLTACSISGKAGQFDVVPETLARTTLGGLRVGSKVNLERALRVGGGLDGHIVQGHVDGVAKVRTIRRDRQYVIEFAAPAALAGEMVRKGSVAIDGVSLTLADVGRESFSVAIIPATLAETTLGELAASDSVNIELDIIGKYVRSYLLGMSASPGKGLTMDRLKEGGFL